jgi:hypothetical protein
MNSVSSNAGHVRRPEVVPIWSPFFRCRDLYGVFNIPLNTYETYFMTQSYSTKVKACQEPKMIRLLANIRGHENHWRITSKSWRPVLRRPDSVADLERESSYFGPAPILLMTNPFTVVMEETGWGTLGEGTGHLLGHSDTGPGLKLWKRGS